MKIEEIFLLVLHGFFTTGTLVSGYMVKKYISRKALGMQTVFDQVIQDTINVIVLETLATWLVVVKFEGAYNEYLAQTLVIIRHFTIIALMLQFFVIVMIRYVRFFLIK